MDALQNQQQITQSPRQPADQNISDINSSITKLKISTTIIIIGILLISALSIGAYWVGRKNTNNANIFLPKINSN